MTFWENLAALLVKENEILDKGIHNDVRWCF